MVPKRTKTTTTLSEEIEMKDVRYNSTFQCPETRDEAEEMNINDLLPDWHKDTVSIEPGKYVQLQDGSFMKIKEKIDNGDALRIRGSKLLPKDDQDLFMQVATDRNELVQLSWWDDEDNRHDIEDTVPVAEVESACTIIYTNQLPQDLYYSQLFHRSEPDHPFYFCRYASSDGNLRIKNFAAGKDKLRPPWSGTIQRMKAHEVDAITLVDQEGGMHACLTTEAKLRASWRGSDHTKLGGSHVQGSGQTLKPEYTFAEPFCGAGGISHGAYSSGLRLVHAFDHSGPAIQTYKHAFQTLRRCDVKVELIGIKEFLRQAPKCHDHVVDFLHMSPPCQPFSGVNTHPDLKKQKPKLKAFYSVGALLKIYRPRFTTMEEVDGLAHKGKRVFFGKLIHFFISNNFSIRWQKVDMATLGVPQSRERLIFIAAAPGERLPTIPKQTHGTGRLPLKTIKDAIRDIPEYAPNHNREEARKKRPKKPAKVNENKPSLTVMTKGNSKTVHHPTKKVYTARELAALQTFPHDYEFFGDFKQQCRQIGNDVPPKFAQVLFTHILGQVKSWDSSALGMATDQWTGNTNDGDDDMGGTGNDDDDDDDMARIGPPV